MSATSGIGIAQELTSAFAETIASNSTTRFLKISIRDESLVPDGTTSVSGSFTQDLLQLQDLLQDNVPAYVLARLDQPSSTFLLVDYVPDTAKVRDKMLYASTRNSLTKHFGTAALADTLFATSKDDLTPAAYAAHQRHLAAPKPMSAREKELEDIKAVERQAGGSVYQAGLKRSSPFGTGVGLNWAPELEDAVRSLSDTSEDTVVTATIDPSTETLVLGQTSPSSAEDLGSKILLSDPSFAFFSWQHAQGQNQVVFIYSCPSASPVKHRMLYSSGSSSVYQTAKSILPGGLLASRKIETSDPGELNGAYLKAELGQSADASRVGTPAEAGEGKPAFAKPRGPARRVR